MNPPHIPPCLSVQELRFVFQHEKMTGIKFKSILEKASEIKKMCLLDHLQQDPVFDQEDLPVGSHIFLPWSDFFTKTDMKTTVKNAGLPGTDNTLSKTSGCVP